MCFYGAFLDYFDSREQHTRERAITHTHTLTQHARLFLTCTHARTQIVNGIELSRVMRTGAVATPARNAIKLGVKLNKVTRLSFLCAPFSHHLHTALPIAYCFVAFSRKHRLPCDHQAATLRRCTHLLSSAKESAMMFYLFVLFCLLEVHRLCLLAFYPHRCFARVPSTHLRALPSGKACSSRLPRR